MSFNNMVQAVTNCLPRPVVQNYAHASATTIGFGIAGGFVAAEMAIRAVADMARIISSHDVDQDRNWDNFSANFGGAIFYGLCAANFIPGTPVIGAAIFAIYSLTKELEEDDYLLTILLSRSVKVITDVIEKVSDGIYRAIIKPISDCLFKILTKIAEIVVRILQAIPLPEHPIWIATGALVTAIVVVKVAQHLLG
jgi:hypothetical protein